MKKIVFLIVSFFPFLGHAEMSLFETSLQHVLKMEGGYAERSDEPGGAVNFGVSQQLYDSWCEKQGKPQRPVKNIKRSEMKAVYRMLWREARCPEIARVSPFLAFAHFDWAVNAGSPRAMKTLQFSVGTKRDGHWGSNTHAALKKAKPRKVIEQYLDRREVLYRKWATGKKSRFLRGWLNRLNAIRRLLPK